MSDPTSPPDDLIKFLQVDSEIQAHIQAAILLDAGIETHVINDGASWAGMLRLSATEGGAGIWIRTRDVEAAKDALARNVADSVDLDWDEVDVGTREDDVEPSPRRDMPWPARISFMVALFMMLLGLLLSIVMLFN